MTTIDSQIPLVDRVQEFEELKTHLTKATQGQGNLVFIAGEAGVGKTRLVEELKTYAQSQGIQILQGWSLYESLTPCMPFIEALRSANLEHLFSREDPSKVECVYLITDTGLLIKDVVREENKLDSTIFAGMLTAVGDFVKDSLTMLSGEERNEMLDSLGYEKYRILIESGKNTNLVVILTGRENEFLINDMRMVLVNVEKDFGNVLKAWDGDDESVKGIDKILETLITSGKYDGIDYVKDNPQIKRNRLFENISLGIERHTKVNPSILCIEDLQWADPSSLALMHYVARNTRKCNLLILGTYRPEDVTEKKEGKTHHLIDAMQLMSREDLYQMIELERLEIEHMDEMLASLLGKTDLTDEFKKQLYKETEGNPFFIVSLVRMLIEEKSIEMKDDVWVLTKKLAEMNIPSKVHDVIERRLNRVKEEGREILDIAAVIGEEFTSAILLKGTNLNKVHLLKQLRILEQNHKLIRSFDTKYKFDHAKVKEVIYQHIPNELRMEYHGIIADCIEMLNKDDLDEVIGDLAFHYSNCGNNEKALIYLLKAAEKAKRDYSNEEAIMFYTRVVELEEEAQKRREMFEVLGEIYSLIGNYNKSIESYKCALKLTEEKDKIAEIKVKIGGFYFRIFEYDESLKICTEALDIIKDKECKEKAFAIHNIGNVHYGKGEYDIALEYWKKSMEIREKIGDLAGIAISRNNIGIIHHEREEYDIALNLYIKSLKTNEKTGDQGAIAASLGNIGHLYHDMGENDKALEHLKKSLMISEKIGLQTVTAGDYLVMAETYLEKSNKKMALDSCNRSFVLSKRLGDKKYEADSKRIFGMIYRVQNMWEESRRNFEESIKIFQGIGNDLKLGKTYYEFAMMWKEKGDVEKAKEHLNKALNIFEKLRLERKVEKVRRGLGIL